MPEIKRIEPGRRFSEAVVCDGVVYLRTSGSGP
jgi:hypothetical protein